MSILDRLYEWRETKDYEKAYARLASQPTPIILDWAFQVETGLQQALEAYGRERDRAALSEARTGAVALLAVSAVLLDRDN